MKSSDTVLSNCHCNSSNSTYPSTATGTSSTPSPFIFPSDYAVPDAKIHFRLGCACIGLKEYAQAVKALQIAISLSPGGQDVAINKKLQEAMR